MFLITGLPEAANVSEFQAVYERSKGMEPKAATLLAALMKGENDVMMMNERLKVSQDERKTAAFVVNHRDIKSHDGDLKPYKDLIMMVSLYSREPIRSSQILLP